MTRTAAVVRECRAEPLDWAGLLEAYPHRPAADPDRLAAFTFNVVNFDILGASTTSASTISASTTPGTPAVRGTVEERSSPRGQGPDSGQLRFVPAPAAYHAVANPGDLCLNFLIRRRPMCAWNYNSRLVAPGTMHRLSTRLTELITLICDQPSITVGEAICARAAA